jgi:hypothetical protein
MKKYLNISTGKLIEESEEIVEEEKVVEEAVNTDDEIDEDAYEQVVKQQQAL